jgi:malate synthase
MVRKIAREIVEVHVTNTAKLPWYIDLLNLNLDNSDLDEARSRIAACLAAFARGERLTANQSFGAATPLTGWA